MRKILCGVFIPLVIFAGFSSCNKTIDRSNQPTGLILHFFDEGTTAGINNLQVTFYNNDTDLVYDMNAISVITSTGNNASLSPTHHVYTNADGEVTVTGLTNSTYSIHAIDTANNQYNEVFHIVTPLTLHVNNVASFFVKRN